MGDSQLEESWLKVKVALQEEKLKLCGKNTNIDLEISKNSLRILNDVK